MIPKLVLLLSWGMFLWLIRRDMARREGISPSIWIPTIWVGIIASRPVSFWLGFGGGTDSLEGSPLDRAFYFVMIFAALYTLSKRRINWGNLISRNWSVFLFYGYLLVSVLWADSAYVSFKRWFKEFGNIIIALVILTEANPEEAFRAVFVRCAYVLMPLSIVFIRYFPELGRRYSNSGGLESIGATNQKNSLGTLVTVCGLVLLWDWFERTRKGSARQDKIERYLPLAMLGVGIYLLTQCDSKTSIVCLVVGGLILGASRVPLLRKRLSALGIAGIAAGVVFYLLDWAFNIKEAFVTSLGRDMTFTGRTDLWRELLALKTDPVVGTGFCSFWSDAHFQSKLPDWLADGRSAHNGYLEVYIDGGAIGIFFLIIMLLAVGWNINRQLAKADDYVLIRFAVFTTMLIGNFSESHFGRMTPVGFIFLLTAIGYVERRSSRRAPARSANSIHSSHGFNTAAHHHAG